MVSISLCMIVKNEEKFLEGCLESVQELVDEMIIVDTGSSDRTVKIAKSYGAKVFHFEWIDDFAAARNESLKHATGDWILVIDADERISEDDFDKIRELVEKKHELAYYLIQRNYRNIKKSQSNLQKTENPSRHKGFSYYHDNKIIRLFQNEKDIFFQGEVHELVEKSVLRLKDDVLEANVLIHHYPELDLEKSRHKKDFYLKITKKKVDNNPEDPLALFQLGREYHQNNRFLEAIKCFRKALLLKETPKEYPSLRSECYHYLGLCYNALNRNFQAKRMLSRAAEENPDSISSLDELSGLYEKDGEDRKASHTYLQMAKIQESIGKPEKARLSLRKSIELDKDNLHARRQLENLLQLQTDADNNDS